MVAQWSRFRQKTSSPINSGLDPFQLEGRRLTSIVVPRGRLAENRGGQARKRRSWLMGSRGASLPTPPLSLIALESFEIGAYKRGNENYQSIDSDTRIAGQ
ncbi:MAG: hypothetical protein ACI9HK_005699 [Pirellulaceae bacterium]|jgi:hypothetical protein